MNILVTGGAGYIGSHIIELLVKKKTNKVIIEIDRFDNKEDALSFAKFIVAALDLKLVGPKSIGETEH